MDQEVTRDSEFAKLREAEELLDMQIDDFKGEQIDPDNEPDLYLPLSAAKALHKALANQAQALATAEADIAALREEVERLRELLKPFARIADMEHRAGPADSVMVNVARCRDARAALSEPQP